MKPNLKAPPGACDTHIHVYDPAYPLAPTAVAAPPKGSVTDYAALQTRLGLERTVVVQPSAYGKDNRCTLEAVAALGARSSRAIVVIDGETDQEEIEALSVAGAVGVRFLMLPGGALGWDELDRVASMAADAGWHVQLQLDGRRLPEHLDQILSWRGQIVIDHVGKFLEPVPENHPSFRCLLDLLETGRFWVKLSAAYEVSRTGPPRYDDVGTLAKALVRAAPERLVWASNWPHPSADGRPPDDASLLDLLLDWAPDATLRRRILVDNPASLYGFA